MINRTLYSFSKYQLIFLKGFFPPVPYGKGNVHYPLRFVSKNGYVVPAYIRRLVSKVSVINTENANM